MNPMLALRQYQKVGAHAQTSEASPHRLVQMLMEGGLARIAQAKGAIERKDIPGKCTSISKAIGIVSGLREGLDLEKCADELADLDGLYIYMMKRLAEANINSDPRILDEVAGLLSTVKKAGMPSPPACSAVLKESTMSLVLQRIADTREALVSALAERNWEAIGELDLACRSCMEDVMAEASLDEEALRNNLEELLHVYKELLEAAMGERQAIANEMSQITQAQKAAKVYHLFG